MSTSSSCTAGPSVDVATDYASLLLMAGKLDENESNSSVASRLDTGLRAVRCVPCRPLIHAFVEQVQPTAPVKCTRVASSIRVRCGAALHTSRRLLCEAELVVQAALQAARDAFAPAKLWHAVQQVRDAAAAAPWYKPCGLNPHLQERPERLAELEAFLLRASAPLVHDDRATFGPALKPEAVRLSSALLV